MASGRRLMGVGAVVGIEPATRNRGKRTVEISRLYKGRARADSLERSLSSQSSKVENSSKMIVYVGGVASSRYNGGDLFVKKKRVNKRGGGPFIDGGGQTIEAKKKSQSWGEVHYKKLGKREGYWQAKPEPPAHPNTQPPRNVHQHPKHHPQPHNHNTNKKKKKKPHKKTPTRRKRKKQQTKHRQTHKTKKKKPRKQPQTTPSNTTPRKKNQTTKQKPPGHTTTPSTNHQTNKSTKPGIVGRGVHSTKRERS